MQKRVQQGFTLLEMSVVITIIGLIIGGILFGRSMLTNSRLQTVITDYDSYVSAVGNFKQAYQALPGDMANATSMWGTDSLGCPSGGGKSGTCNGNGDGMVNTSGTVEVFRFWQHLYYAKMLNQKMSGVATSGTLTGTIGVNEPTGSIEGSGWAAGYVGNIGNGDPNNYAGYYGNVLVFGSAYPNYGTSGAILTADQAASIDSKLDDGKPGTGKVRSLIYGSTITPNCGTSIDPVAAVYNVSSTAVNCSLIFILGY